MIQPVTLNPNLNLTLYGIGSTIGQAYEVVTIYKSSLDITASLNAVPGVEIDIPIWMVRKVLVYIHIWLLRCTQTSISMHLSVCLSIKVFSDSVYCNDKVDSCCAVNGIHCLLALACKIFWIFIFMYGNNWRLKFFSEIISIIIRINLLRGEWT